MRYYVDFDGTLELTNRLDNTFRDLIKTIGIKMAIEWYDNQYIDDLPLDMNLINTLIEYYNKGDVLILWTNRGPKQFEMTMKNLGKYKYLFTEFIFGEGRKPKVTDGIVIENE
jgi:hypothetical protein